MSLTLDPEAAPWVEVYRRLTEAVVPRAIALVSTCDPEGRANLAPFSFFTIVSCNPPHLAFAPQLAGRTGERKDTLRNVESQGQFVVAVVTETMAAQVNSCSKALAYGASEFEHSGLTPAPALRVRPSLVAESPVNMECELVEIHSYGTEGGAGNLVVGRLVMLHASDEVLTADGAIDPERLAAVGRMGGSTWSRTRDRFELERP